MEMWTVSLDVSEPGVIRVGAGPYQPFAVLDGRLDPIISATRTRLPHYLQGKLKKTSPTNDIIETQAVWHESIALGDLARVILAEGHGGTLLIVPDDSGVWQASLDPFAYRLAEPDTTIRDGIREQLRTTQARAQAMGEVSKLDIPDETKNLLMKSLRRPRHGTLSTSSGQRHPWRTWTVLSSSRRTYASWDLARRSRPGT